jgi:hypothetical protein
MVAGQMGRRETQSEHLNFSNTELAGWLHWMTSHYIQAWSDPVIAQTAALEGLGKRPIGKRKSRLSPMPIS